MQKRSNRLLTIFVPIAIGVVVPYVLYFSFWNREKLPIESNLMITNEPLPSSVLIDIKSGVNFSEEIRRGKVLLIFLSSDCFACKKDIETISKFYLDLTSKIKIYGVSFEKREKTLNFMAEKKVPFPVLDDTNSELSSKLQIKYFPTKYLIEDGVILKTFIGSFASEEKLFQDLQIGDTK